MSYGKFALMRPTFGLEYDDKLALSEQEKPTRSGH